MKIKNIIFFTYLFVSAIFVDTSFCAENAPTPQRHGVTLKDLDKLEPQYEESSGFQKGTFDMPRPDRSRKVVKPIPDTFSRDASTVDIEESSSAATGYSSDKINSSEGGYTSYGTISKTSGSGFNQDTMSYRRIGNKFFPVTTSSLLDDTGSEESTEEFSIETTNLNSPHILLSMIDFTIKALTTLNDEQILINYLNTIVVSINKLHTYGYLDPLHINELQRRLSISINGIFSIYGLGYERCTVLQLVIIYLQGANSVNLLLNAGAEVNDKFDTLPEQRKNLSFYKKTLDLALFVEDKKKAGQIANLLISKGATCSEEHEYAIKSITEGQRIESAKQPSRLKSFFDKFRRKKGE